MKLATRAAAAIAAAGVASFTYQRVAEVYDRRRFPPPGQLVDIGGRRLHLVAMGEGSPAVVIVPAIADNVLGWLPVAEGAAGETLTCVYDRAEVGWSDPPPHGRRTLDGMAADLYALLTAAVPPPYILVGHSIGGVIARRFYAQHPGLVAGMLLVDSSSEGQQRRIAAVDWPQGPNLLIRVAAWRQARPLGLRRLAAALGLAHGLDAEVAREAPPEYAGPYRAIMLSTRQRHVQVRELLMAALRNRGEPPGLGAIPLTVLTRAPRPPRHWHVWARMQDELAALSTDSVHIHAERAGHYIHLDEPDLVIQAIRDLIRRCR